MIALALILACSGPDDEFPSSESDADTDTDTDSDTDTDTDTDTDVDAITKEDEAAILAAAAADLETYEATGAQIAVWANGHVAYHWEVGVVGDSGKPITEDMLFQIGSDTKKLTAIAFLQQEEAGTLSRDDSVASVLKDFALAEDAGWSKSATFHQLLSNQGDVYDYTPWDPAPDDADLRERAYGEFAERAWTYAPAGSFWNYANPNFALAGLAVEVAAGRPFADVLQEDVVDALGLTHTFVRLTDVEKYGNNTNGHGFIGWADDPFDVFYSGHNFTFGEITLDDIDDNAFTRPAGLVWSTAEDQAALAGFFLEGNPAVLSDANREAILAPQVLLYPAISWLGYGYGTQIQDGFYLDDGYHDERLVLHGGNTYSMTSLWWILPAEGVGIAILSNGFADDFSLTTIQILERLDVVPRPTKKKVGEWFEETDHALLTGTYVDPDLGEMDVWDDKGTLRITIPALEPYGVTDEPMYFGLTDFYWVWMDGDYYDFTFIRDGKGTYTWLRNRLMVGTRGSRSRAPLSSRTTGTAGAEGSRSSMGTGRGSGCPRQNRWASPGGDERATDAGVDNPCPPGA